MKMSTTEKEIIGEIICAMLGERRCKKSSRYRIQNIDDYRVTLVMDSEDDPFYEDIVELIEYEKKQNAYLGIQRLGYASCVSTPEKPIVDPVVEQYFHEIEYTNGSAVQFTVQFPISFKDIKFVITKFIESERLGLNNINYPMLMEMIENDIAAGKYDVDDDDYI